MAATGRNTWISGEWMAKEALPNCLIHRNKVAARAQLRDLDEFSTGILRHTLAAHALSDRMMFFGFRIETFRLVPRSVRCRPESGATRSSETSPTFVRGSTDRDVSHRRI
jgi:hypothetical protein